MHAHASPVPQHGLLGVLPTRLHSPSLNADTFLVSSEDAYGQVFRQELRCISFLMSYWLKVRGL